MGQLCTYLPGAGRQVKQGRKGHKKDIENLPSSGAGRRLRLLFERITEISSQPLYSAWRPWPRGPFPARPAHWPVLPSSHLNESDDHPRRARSEATFFWSISLRGRPLGGHRLRTRHHREEANPWRTRSGETETAGPAFGDQPETSARTVGNPNREVGNHVCP